ncbi:YciI family protein [Caulobacter segnis]|uniref:YciI family protein n=1 Tax=Caulobacter segnis TaxID=88688 RepID=UPI00241098B5|nr:YciI family protein [Caulobacter segnis]MDG2520017.1 YciI family protein [Caulobacter segnis]
MKYLMLIAEPENAYEGEAGEAKLTEIVGKHMALVAELQAAGALLGGDGLQPSFTATTVRTQGGAQTVHDGPFAETKEQVGGYYLIEAADLDAALAWAKKIPVVDGGMVEVRPVAEY